MNYERVMSIRYDRSRRHGHRIFPCTLRTLCGKQLDDRWWKPGQCKTVCKRCECVWRACQSQQAVLPETDDQDERKRIRALLEKIGHKLNLSPRQYQITNAMKTHGVLWPKEIEEKSGISYDVIRAQLAQLCAKHGITADDLRCILPYVALTDPSTKRRKPTVYLRGGTHVAVYAKDGKEILIGCWSNRDDALAGWRAWVAGKPFPVPPNKRGTKPYIRKQGNRYHPFLYDKESKKQIYICSCKSYDEAIAAWQHAKQNGVYIPGRGIVKL